MPYGMGHLKMAVRIMGYQNCVSYKQMHERRLGTSFCGLNAFERQKAEILHDNGHSNNNDFLNNDDAVTS